MGRLNGPENGRMTPTEMEDALSTVFGAQEAKKVVEWTLAQEAQKTTEEVDISDARKIMGENFFGPNEIGKVFGRYETFDTDPLVQSPHSALLSVPTIPYTRERLVNAAKNDEKLILRINYDKHNNPMTMQNINNAFVRRNPNDGSIEGEPLFKFQNPEDYSSETYQSETPKNEWKLITTKFIPNCLDKNYIDQTRALRDYLLSINILTENEAEQCTDEILNKLSEQLDRNPKEVLKALTDLPINKNHRRSPVEAVYDFFLQLKSTNTPGILDLAFDSSNALSPDGASTLSVGCFNPKIGGVIKENGPLNHETDTGVIATY